jgi:simple sugar transport system permease protein
MAVAAPVPASVQQGSGLFARLTRRTESYLLLVIVVIGAVLAVSTSGFLTLNNLLSLLNTYAVTGVLAAGLLVVLISGNIDISFAATTMVAQYLTAILLMEVIGPGLPVEFGGVMFNLGWLVVFGVAMLIGVALGAVNALLVHYLRASSIIVTIATLNVFFGLLMFFSGGKQLYRLPRWSFQGVIAEIPLPDGGTLRLSIQIVVLVLVFLVTWWLLNHTAIGRQVYAMGGNPDAARRLGFNVRKLNLFAFGYLGATAGVAAVIHAQLQQQVAPNVLVGRELDVLAAVVLGGASLLGGVGTVGGTILGIALLAVLQNGLLLIGVSSYWLSVYTGLVILVSVCVTALSDRMRQRRRVRGVV